jgi:hypothetical protein
MQDLGFDQARRQALVTIAALPLGSRRRLHELDGPVRADDEDDDGKQ